MRPWGRSCESRGGSAPAFAGPWTRPHRGLSPAPPSAPSQPPQGATFLYEHAIRPLLYVTADALKDVPAVEPYVREFVRGHRTEIAEARKAGGEALAKAEDAVGKQAKHAAAAYGAAAGDEAEEGELFFQPLMKAHHN